MEVALLLQLAKLFTDFGPWGLTAFFAYLLYRSLERNDTLRDKQLEGYKEITTALSASTDALRENNKLLLIQEARTQALASRIRGS